MSTGKTPGGGEPTSPGRRKALVLAIDDEQAMLEVYAELLGRAGLDVVTDQDPRHAAERVAADGAAIDLVLLDLRMSGLDGHDLLGAIRARRPDVPVIVVTGYPSRESAQRCRALGVEHYVRKPFDPDDLIRRVRRALTQGPNADPR